MKEVIDSLCAVDFVMEKLLKVAKLARIDPKGEIPTGPGLQRHGMVLSQTVDSHSHVELGWFGRGCFA